MLQSIPGLYGVYINYIILAVFKNGSAAKYILYIYIRRFLKMMKFKRLKIILAILGSINLKQNLARVKEGLSAGNQNFWGLGPRFLYNSRLCFFLHLFPPQQKKPVRTLSYLRFFFVYWRFLYRFFI